MAVAVHARPLPGTRGSFAEGCGQVALEPMWPGRCESELTLESRGRAQRGGDQFYVGKNKADP